MTRISHVINLTVSLHRFGKIRPLVPPHLPNAGAPVSLSALPHERSTHDIDPSDLKNPALYINRELSWLEFNQRVLAQASDSSQPLLERVKFLAIVGTNLDEFFMIRVATTAKKQREGLSDVAPDGHSTGQQLDAMRTRAGRQLDDLAACWSELRDLLAAEHISFLDPEAWTPEIREFLASHFARNIGPVLTPLAFDPGHPFPLISNLSKNFAVVVRHANRTKFARVKVPDPLPRFVQIPEALSPRPGLTFVFLEDVIRANIQELFPGASVRSAHLFRVIRDADLDIEQDEADDLLETVDRSLKQLRRGALSLLEVDAAIPTRVLNILAENFEATGDEILRTSSRIGFGDWLQLTAMHRPELKYAPFSPHPIWRSDEDPEVIFDQLRDQDVIVHHPYESFGSVEAFLRAGVRDPNVLAIKMTLYRIGANSPLINLLIQAAEAGKQVAVLVELKARFDERNNIIWARRLESLGIHVVYGFTDLKTHAKLCLLVRREGDRIRGYVHTSTGNYNRETARIYTDVGLFTADPDIVEDVTDVFNYLTGYSNQQEFRSLLVGPMQLRSRLCDLITREADHARAGRPARIIMKVNAITDDEMIRVLYSASQAGVEIELVVRAICSLRPGVRGVSDNIRVRSIVGRFLEHSRLFWFQNDGNDEMYVGSADLMERNLARRVETLAPIRNAEIRRHLLEVVLQADLQDTERAMVLDAEGNYSRPEGLAGFNAQQLMLKHYVARSD
jgi:polyphosphate kinase